MPRSILQASPRSCVLVLAIWYVCPTAISQAQAPAGKDAKLTDQERIRRILDDVRKLQKDPPAAEDSRKIATAQAASQIADTASRLASSRQLQSDQNRAFSDVIRGVDRTALPPGDDITYPKDWKARTQARSSSLVEMSPKEKALFRALNSTMTIRLKNARFEEVIDYLQSKTGLSIVLDRAMLTAADISYDSTVSVDLKDVSVRTVLRKVLADLNLTYVIRNEAIMVVTPAVARQMQVTRVYYVRDLLPGGWGFFSAVQAAQLIDMIQTTVEPQSWRANGGDGTIVYDPVRRALIVKQSAEFQSVLSGGASASK